MKCGIRATIMAYRSYNDMDVTFANGVVRKHVTTNDFNRRIISPKPNKKDLSEYVGMTKMMKCGMNATIIACRNARDIDIQFEDGSVRKHIEISKFNKKKIPHPHHGLIFHKYQIQKPAFMFENTNYFYVTYEEDGMTVTDVMSIDIMRNHLEQSENHLIAQIVDTQY